MKEGKRRGMNTIDMTDREHEELSKWNLQMLLMALLWLTMIIGFTIVIEHEQKTRSDIQYSMEVLRTELREAIKGEYCRFWKE